MPGEVRIETGKGFMAGFCHKPPNSFIDPGQGARSDPSASSEAFRKKQIFIRDIRYPGHQHSHLAFRAVHDPWRDVNQ